MDNKDKFNFSIIKENLYTQINPTITSEKNGIVYFNAENNDNQYFQKIIDLYENASSINANFINLKKRLTYASGLLPVDDENQTLVDFINKKNLQGDDVNDVFLKLCMDYSLFESAAVQLIYNASGKIDQILHISMSKLRAEEPNDLGVVDAWYFAKDWSKIRGSMSVFDKRFKNPKAVRIPVFNPSTGKEDKRQILVMKKYSPSNQIYAIPSYSAGIPYIELDHELAKFHLNAVTNGFFPTFLLNMIGSPSKEEKSRFVSDFNTKFTGTGSGMKGIYFWNDSHEDAPKLDRMTQDTNEKMFEVLQNTVYQQVSTAHGGSMLLAGFETSGGDLSGDASQINIERLAFISRVIEDFQRVLLKNLNNIIRFNELGEVIVINENLKLEQPLQQNTDLTEDERREMIFGLPPKNNDNIDETNTVNE